jgi:ribosome biogenesis GTPase A
MAINWFPGHMVKTKREIMENLKLVDAVIEIRDARIVKSSANPDIDEICKNKPRLILLNKSDLSENSITKVWINKLSSENIKVLSVNCLTGNGIKGIKPTLDVLLKEKHDRLIARGISNITTRVMVVGIPNVGKSSFINKMANNSIAKTGDKPGVTKNKQWIKTSIGIELMDTPGVLWPRFEDVATAQNLAFTGAIKDEVMDIEELALNLVKVLALYYPERLKQRYKIDELSIDALENLNKIAVKRGSILSAGKIDYKRIAIMIMDEFRGGKLGPISLERP